VRRITYSALFALCIFSVLQPPPACSDAGYKPSEYEVKAAFLFNFGKFVRWPADAARDSTFNICVLGRDPFGRKLDTVTQGERVDGKSFTVSRISSPAEATACRIVFISASEERHLASILQSLSKHPILTVSDISGFASHGGMIEFIVDGDRVRFDVNMTASQSADLKLSSELLRVAAHVTGGGRS
jgi:hypothetical protein